MKPTGIVSIQASHDPSPERSFDHLMAGVGHNTGNLLFTNALWDQIEGRKRHVGYHFKPELLNGKIDRLVIAAANWFNPRFDMDDLAKRVEKLDMPVVMIGLGAQNDESGTSPLVPEGTQRLIRAVAARSSSISLRGEYTRAVLNDYGISKTCVTGCPSLYTAFSEGFEQRLAEARGTQGGRVLLHSTRYISVMPRNSTHRKLFALAYRLKWDLLLQSEREEISLLVSASEKPEIDLQLARQLLRIYNTSDWMNLRDYVRDHGRVFFDTNAWSAAMQGYSGAYGTRLHATIMALNSGVPAVLVHHDTRTQELAEFAQIPHISEKGAAISEKAIRSALADADITAYLATRRKNLATYIEFLNENGVPHKLRAD